MTNFKYIVFFFLLAFNSIGQENLILNGDFEEYWECPSALTEIEKCKYVYNPCLNTPPQWSATSDYFNRCFGLNTSCGVPYNTFGYQEPKSGDGYLGLINTQIIGDYKEYIQLEIKKPLKAYNTYSFSIYVNLGDFSGYTTNFLHFKFVDILTYYQSSLSDFMQPDVVLDNLILEDTVEWTRIEFDYIARGEEKYLIIGNFNMISDHDSYYLFDVNPINGGEQTYFYFDDASLELIKKAEPITFPNVFTPNGDNVNDIFSLLQGEEQVEKLFILNRWGNVVYESESDFSWNGADLNGNEVSEGVYFVRIHPKYYQEGKKEQYQGIVHLIR